ncbi:basic proline-rich protein-like [Alosa sapidissima]|uniref:basic proline-rich protein-like n=1 Tax=Alosa sapidissima TaxID=34773 RepID=UPI001C08DE52|nr:basic proline-rich protein-like [Alosa sapidissima]
MVVKVKPDRAEKKWRGLQEKEAEPKVKLDWRFREVDDFHDRSGGSYRDLKGFNKGSSSVPGEADFSSAALRAQKRAVPPEGARGPEESEDDDGDQGPPGPPPDSPGEDDGGGEQRGGPSARRSTRRRILPAPADDPGRNVPRVPAVFPPLSVPTGAGNAGAEPGSRRGRRHPPEVGATPKSQVSRPATASTSGDPPADPTAHPHAATTPDLTGSNAEETPGPEEEAPPPPPPHQQGNDTIDFGDFYADWDYPYPADAPADDQTGAQPSAAEIAEALDALRLPAVLTPPPRTPPRQGSQLPAEPVEGPTDSGHTTGGPHFRDSHPGTSQETRQVLQGIGLDGSLDAHWTGGFEEALDWPLRRLPEDDESNEGGTDCHPQ